MQVLIGTDPEIFVKNRKGQIVSAHDLVPGTKEDPFPVDKGAIQVDGTALEFNIAPAKSEDEFVDNIISVTRELSSKAFGYADQKSRSDSQNLSFAIVPVAHFEKDTWEKIPGHAKQLGCTPDFNAYSMEMNTPPQSNKPFRTASGHIHVGWTDNVEDIYSGDHFETCCDIVKQLDIALYVPSLIFDPSQERRQLYGKPGSFRPKPYGCEYRVLSNAWLKGIETMDLELVRWIYNQTNWAVRLYFEKGIALFEKFDTEHNPDFLALELEQMGAPDFPWAFAYSCNERKATVNGCC